MHNFTLQLAMIGKNESLISIYFSRVMLVTHTYAQFYATTRHISFVPLYGEVQDASSLTSSGSTSSRKISTLLKERYQCPERWFLTYFSISIMLC